MDIFLMYVLMIVDLTWTLIHHEEVGELNPVFSRLLLDNEVMFVYLKLAANSIAAVVVIILRHRRPVVSYCLTAFGILIYGFVVWMHWFVDHCVAHAGQVEESLLWSVIRGG